MGGQGAILVAVLKPSNKSNFKDKILFIELIQSIVEGKSRQDLKTPIAKRKEK